MIQLKHLIKENKRYELFCDMDSVLTDFHRQFKEISGGIDINKYSEKHGEDATWQFVSEYGEEFWSKMYWMPDGKKLWNYIKYKEPKILSTPTRNKLSRSGKKKWVKQNLGNIEVLLEQNKEKYSGKNKILIDDKLENIQKWNSMGGTGILHKTAIDTIKQLKELGI